MSTTNKHLYFFTKNFKIEVRTKRERGDTKVRVRQGDGEAFRCSTVMYTRKEREL